MSKANKNDIVVITFKHSYTNAKLKKAYYDRFYIAVVTKTNRNGLVKEAQKIGVTSSYVIDDEPNIRVLTIEDPQKQNLARALAKKLKDDPAKNYYENQDRKSTRLNSSH